MAPAFTAGSIRAFHRAVRGQQAPRFACSDKPTPSVREREEAGGFTWEEGTGSDEAPSLAGDGGDCEAASGELALRQLQPRRHSSFRAEQTRRFVSRK